MHDTYKILEWNIHKMTKNVLVKPFVIERIKQDCPDIVILVEYKYDCNIEQSLLEDYYVDVAIGKNGNDVLMAIKKCIVLRDTKPIFNKSVIKASLGSDHPTVLEARFQTKDQKMLSVIGLRYVQGGDAIKVSKYLRTYLNGIQHEFVCVGDFNVLEFRMPIHYGQYYHEEYDGEFESSSVIMLYDFRDCIIKGFQRLDHVIYSPNINKESLKYSWDFIEKSAVYPKYNEITEGYVWKIPVAYPDHAILEFEFHID